MVAKTGLFALRVRTKEDDQLREMIALSKERDRQHEHEGGPRTERARSREVFVAERNRSGRIRNGAPTYG